MLVMLAFVMLVPETGHAATPPSAGNCTSFTERAALTLGNTANPKPGLLSEVNAFIKTTIGAATQRLFEAFTSSAAYQRAVGAAMTLMVLFYAVGFTIGVVQPSFQQVLIRLVKLGLIGAIISPTGWTFFSQYVVTFFQDGSDQLINGVQAIGFGIAAPAGAGPFYALDRVTSFLIDPDTIVAIMGSVMSGGPFGMAMGGLMVISTYSFFKLILKTLQIYAVTFVARSLVLGVAPLFFVFLMFDRTKNMFIAWVNALINLSLQPILMFTFLSFFLVLIESSAQNMLGAELCWHEFQNVVSGVNKMAFWRFADPVTGQVSTGDWTWNGSLECLVTPNIADQAKCKDFPLNILDILSFLILVFLATRFAEVVEKISSELSNAVVNLDNQGKLDQLMERGNKGTASALGSGMNPRAGGVRGR